MRLYLVRHGEAVPQEVDGERPLSDKGRRDVQRMAVFLARSGARIERIIHSGKRRALETALAFAKVGGPGGLVEEGKGLSPRSSIAPLCEAAAEWEADTMVVGHLPFMAKAVAGLVVGDEEAELVDMTPGSVACLVRDDTTRRWTLAWLLRPDLLGQ